MYLEHPVFETPADSTIIWRYTTWGRLCDILTRNSLFFARAMSFDDPWESSYHRAPVRSRRALGFNNTSSAQRRPGTTICSRNGRSERRSRKAAAPAPSAVGTCPTTSPTRTGASTVTVVKGLRSGQAIGDLKRALDAYKDRSVKIGEVKYVDYETARLPTDNGFWPIVHKRLAYINDKEVRGCCLGRRARSGLRRERRARGGGRGGSCPGGSSVASGQPLVRGDGQGSGPALRGNLRGPALEAVGST